MEICEKPKVQHLPSDYPEAIPGHIYRCVIGEGSTFNNKLYLCVKRPNGNHTLYSLSHGEVWSSSNTFGTSAKAWVDVTAQYCLIKKDLS